MFISTSEKEEIKASIKMLQVEIKVINEQIERLAKYIITRDAPPVKKRQGRQWNEASKQAASERMKKHWEERKAKKETS